MVPIFGRSDRWSAVGDEIRPAALGILAAAAVVLAVAIAMGGSPDPLALAAVVGALVGVCIDWRAIRRAPTIVDGGLRVEQRRRWWEVGVGIGCGAAGLVVTAIDRDLGATIGLAWLGLTPLFLVEWLAIARVERNVGGRVLKRSGWTSGTRYILWWPAPPT